MFSKKKSRKEIKINLIILKFLCIHSFSLFVSWVHMEYWNKCNKWSVNKNFIIRKND